MSGSWELPSAPDGGRTPGTGVTRSQLVPVLVLLACIVLATVLVRVSEPRLDFDAARTTVGRPTTLDGGTVTVTAVRAATALSYGRSDPPLTTPGMFVVLDVELEAGVEKAILNGFELRSGDHLYSSYTSASLSAPPHWVASGSVTFEVDPAHIDGLTATMWRNEVLHGYQQKAVVPVGITAANADQWRASAAGRTLTVEEYPQSRPAS